MRLKQNANSDVLLNPNDIAALVAGNPVTFWIILEDHEDITFALRKDL